MLIAICMLEPTFDDWTYFTTPYYDFTSNITDRLIPRYSYWRPFDCLFGLLLTIDHRLFPLLNHIAVFAAHIMSALMVYKLSRMLSLGRESSWVATLFFFFSPAMLGTVLGIDSLNQAYSHLWGMLAIHTYLRGRHSLWILCSLLSLFCKENGIAFFFIPIIIKWAVNREENILIPLRNLCVSLAVIGIYFLFRVILESNVVYINEEYFDSPAMRIASNMIRFVSLSLIPMDYVSVATAATLNYPLALITLALSMPFMIMLAVKGRRILLSPLFVTLIVSALVAAAPHIATLFTTMHAYAGLGFIAIAIGMLWQSAYKKETADKDGTDYKSIFRNPYMIAFLLSCLIIDVHHWYCSYESGMQGKRMAEKVLKTIQPKPKLCVLYIDTNESKYSSFCVIPYDAFGWGKAVRHYGDGVNPAYIDNYTFQPNDTTAIHHYVDSIRTEGYKDVLVVEGSEVDTYGKWLEKKKNANNHNAR